jgi:hypothetical protein
MAVQTTTLAGTSESTIITAGPSGVNNALYGLVITTVNGAVGTLTFKDSTGGTTRLVIDFPNAVAVPNYPFVLFLPYDRPLYQAAPANNWTVTASANATSYHINAFYLEM